VLAGGRTAPFDRMSTRRPRGERAIFTVNLRIQALAFLALAAALTACEARRTTAPPVPANLERLSGHGQTGSAGQALPQPLVVAVTTTTGTGVAGVTVTWTVAAGSGAVSAQSTTTDAQGHAAVLLTLGPRVGTNVDTVTATASGLTGSPALFVASASAGPPAQLIRASGDNQTGVVGDTLPARLIVVARDQFGNPVSGVSVGWTVTAGGGSISSAAVNTDAQGMASVAWTLGHQAGSANNTATASAAGLAGSPLSFTANATAGPATHLALVSGDNQADTVAHLLADSLIAAARDQFDNPVAGVLVTWAVTAGGGALSAASGFTDTQGRSAVAWTLGDSVGTQHAAANLTGVGAPLVFTATGIAAPTTHLAFAVQPTTVTAGSPIAPAIEVRALDGTGSTEPSFTDDVTLALGANPGGGSLSGTLTVTAVAGVATFSNVSLDSAAAGYTLIASTAALSSVTSATFDVTAGSATQLAFTTQPASTTAGTTLSIVQVTARDALGNTAAGFAGAVTVAIGTNPGGATLSGTKTITASGGIAAFNDLSLDKPGTGYTLTAAAAGVAGATSATFDIAPGAPTQLAFTVQPSNADTGTVITPAIQATARDALGNTATAFMGNVSIAIATNPAGGTLSGTTTVAATAGIAVFSNLRIDKGGTGYTLQASASGLSTATSTAFDVTVPPPAGSVVVATGDGQSGLAGYALNGAPAVLVRDTLNAPLAGVSVTFGVTSGGGSVSGGTTTTDVNGVATLGAWTVQLGGNTLTATVAAAGITGNPVTFTATGVAAGYHIDVRFLTAMTPSRQAAFNNAAAKWETLIYGDVPDVMVNTPANACAPNTPALNETIDDIVIFATLDSIDGPGNILGQAGPCGFRGSGLPFLGAMMFDSADVAQLETDGDLGAVIMHEMGHVLGYGTIWSGLSLLVGGGGSDPHFVGPEALAAFDDNGGQSYSAGAKVPVENCCGPGTQDAHWRESVFVTELMTGFLNSGVPNPLSVITTASMGDLGYTVNYAGSDPYVVVNPLLAVRAAGGRIIELRDDILRLPMFTVDAAGHVVNVRPPR
jgi:Bacterial Ig-like domain (group 1)/Leishmanolysin